MGSDCDSVLWYYHSIGYCCVCADLFQDIVIRYRRMNRQTAAQRYSTAEYDGLNDSDTKPSTSKEHEDTEEESEEEEEENHDQEYNDLSIEDLLKLQENVGTKAFKNTVLTAGRYGLVS